MAVFLLVYFVVYGGIHLYVYVKVRRAFRLTGRRRFALIVVLFGLTLAPILVRALARPGFPTAARLLGAVCFVWMAAVFWFFVLSVCGDVWNLAVRVLGRWAPRARRVALGPRAAVAVFSGAIVGGVAWGLVEASSIRVKEFTLDVPRLERPIRLVHMSDVHLGLLVGEGRLRRIARLAAAARPDILVSTGDLVDGSSEELGHLARILAGVEAPLGKFAVTGNHEYYPGLEGSLAFHRAAGFRVLRGEWLVVAETLGIAGVDDPAGWRRGERSFTDEDAALPAGDDRLPTVFLKHRPAVSPDSVGRFDLQLSGHVHGGQIFPFGLLVRLVYPLTPGLHRLERGSAVYVSRGVGTWGPPLRFLSPPEIAVFTLRPAAGAP